MVTTRKVMVSVVFGLLIFFAGTLIPFAVTMIYCIFDGVSINLKIAISVLQFCAKRALGAGALLAVVFLLFPTFKSWKKS